MSEVYTGRLRWHQYKNPVTLEMINEHAEGSVHSSNYEFGTKREIKAKLEKATVPVLQQEMKKFGGLKTYWVDVPLVVEPHPVDPVEPENKSRRKSQFGSFS